VGDEVAANWAGAAGDEVARRPGLAGNWVVVSN